MRASAASPNCYWPGREVSIKFYTKSFWLSSPCTQQSASHTGVCVLVLMSSSDALIESQVLFT